MEETSLAGELAERAVGTARRKSAQEIDLLLAAAEAVLARSGYGGLRIDDVLAQAGLSTRAFYRHFRGKSELFLALFDRETARAQERLRAKMGTDANPEQRVAAWVIAALALAYDARLAPRTRLFLVERHVIAAEFPAEMARCLRAQLEPLEDAIADGRDAGVFPYADPARDALAIHHLCSGLMHDRLLGIGSLPRVEAVALATGFARQSLRADGRQRRSK